MKIKILSLLLASAMSISLLASCSGGSSPRNVGAANTLKSVNESISFNVVENSLYITDLSTAKNSVNKLVENSELSLPQYIKVNNKKVELQWEYVSTLKYKDEAVNGVLTDGLIYNFKEPSQNLELRVYCVVRPEISGPFEIYMEVDNLGETEQRIFLNGDFSSVSVKIEDPESTNIMRVASEGFIAEGHAQNKEALNNYRNGVMYKGTGIYISGVTGATKLQSSARPNFSGNGGFYTVQYIDRGTDGVFYALAWTAGKVSTRVEDEERVVMRSSLDNSGGEFSTLIQPGDTFRIPSVYVLPYEGDVDTGSNVFKSWFFDCKVVSALRDDPALPYVQIDAQMTPEEAKEVGIDSIKFDYGWWSGYGFGVERALPYEGSWTLLAEEKDSPRGWTYENLKNYGEKVDSLGMNFATYILLHETVDEDGNPSDQYGELNAVTHPDWFADQRHPFCRLADLGNVECVEYLKKTLENFFVKNNVDQWRTDFEPIAAYSDQKNRHDANGSDVIYWCTVGFTEIVQHLYETVEGFKFESCNSGGGNKDLYIAELTTFFNCDDTANYLSLRASFYDSSYIIHPAQLEIPCNPETFNPSCEQYFFPVVPEPEVSEGDDYDFQDAMMDMGFRSTIIGIPMWGSWSGTIHWDYYKEYANLYKEKVKPLVRDGELYHILPRPDGTNWDGIMYADPDSKNDIKGVVFLFKPSAEVSDTYNVVLRGLNADTVYQLTFEDRPEQNTALTGAELMSNGINVEIKYVGSEMIWITEAE